MVSLTKATLHASIVHIDTVATVLLNVMQVLVMSSMRKPKRIMIRGDDEKEYLFLVKGGEDLRQDQRIEQVLVCVRVCMCVCVCVQPRVYSVITHTPPPAVQCDERGVG